MIIIAKISIVPPPLLKQTTPIVASAYNLVNAQSMVAIFAQLKIPTIFLVSSFLQLNYIPTDVRVILPRKNIKRLPWSLVFVESTQANIMIIYNSFE
jgi:hypothetical protein